MFKGNSIFWFRLMGILLVVPNMIREWLDTFTDIGSYQGNVALINKIISYHPTVVQTMFDRSIHNTWLAPVGAVGFILMHLVAALLLSFGVIQMIYYLKAEAGHYKKLISIVFLGLVIIIVCYLFFFGVIAMDYFMSQLQGFDYSIPIVYALLPSGIALFYLLHIE